MELRSVKEEVKKEYPKMGQVKNKKLKKCIPSRWYKMGLTSFMLGLILKNTAYATSPTKINDKTEGSSSSVVGEMVVTDQTAGETTVMISHYIAIGGIVISIIGIIISLIFIIKNAVSNKKNNSENNNSQKPKNTIIIPIILLIIFIEALVVSILFL